MSKSSFTPHHMNACEEDLAGNGGIGRYLFVPGSDGRAAEIADHFLGLTVKKSPRCHNLYLGSLALGERRIDVAAMSTGMGTPSVDIIIHELFKLGCRRFVRVGTAGSLQKSRVRVGDVVAATAAVRDEATSRLYLPAEFPAIASLDMVLATRAAAQRLGLSQNVHFGVVHSKDSLFAREFGEGPMHRQNREYMEMIEKGGALASEMEASHLFILSSLFTQDLGGEIARQRVLAGCVLGIIGDDRPFAPPEEAKLACERAVSLALETVRQLAAIEVPT
jgi:uridine phosphorylase